MKDYFLAADAAIETTETGQRTFRGVAYSGAAVRYWGERIVIDVESMQFKDKIAVLLQHNDDMRAGSGVFTKENNALNVSGALLSNEHGAAIAKDSDEGFPWQMSVRVSASNDEYIETGEVSVNGENHQAPIIVLRNAEITEVSFCAIGRDRNTSAKALSEQIKQFSERNNLNHEEKSMTEAEKKLSEKLSELEKRLAESESTAAKALAEKEEAIKLAADAKAKSNAEMLLSAAGIHYEDDAKQSAIVNAVKLAADEDKQHLIEALKSKAVPDALFSETTLGSSDDESNPLLASVKAHNESMKGGSHV